jgi:hypothetical protein
MGISEILRMAYIVKAMDYEGGAISTTVDDQKRALAVAIGGRLTPPSLNP